MINLQPLTINKNTMDIPVNECKDPIVQKTMTALDNGEALIQAPSGVSKKWEKQDIDELKWVLSLYYPE